MSRSRLLVVSAGSCLAVTLMVVGARQALAHCDGLDGPVVTAARRALESGNVNLALIWVQPKDEGEVRAAFRASTSVRQLSTEAAALADRHFFETLVRLHRAGEGAPYTGLKPAGRDLGPAIPAADQALLSGRIVTLENLLIEDLRRGLRAHFTEVQRRRAYDANDLREGREYVNAYVEFIHYVERLHETASGVAAGHYSDGAH